jgi:hypothetical protein
VSQSPQCATSLLVLTQLASHSVSPAVHSIAHTPRSQTSPVAQLTAQSPQWAASVLVVVHTPPHSTSATSQALACPASDIPVLPATALLPPLLGAPPSPPPLGTDENSVLTSCPPQRACRSEQVIRTKLPKKMRDGFFTVRPMSGQRGVEF